MKDDQITEYINKYFIEQLLQDHENELLQFLKIRQEKYPSEKNDADWLDFSNFVCRRRYQQQVWNDRK